jgi:hypothetical protein
MLCVNIGKVNCIDTVVKPLAGAFVAPASPVTNLSLEFATGSTCYFARHALAIRWFSTITTGDVSPLGSVYRGLGRPTR